MKIEYVDLKNQKKIEEFIREKPCIIQKRCYNEIECNWFHNYSNTILIVLSFWKISTFFYPMVLLNKLDPLGIGDTFGIRSDHPDTLHESWKEALESQIQK
ncbi:MAG: hypothetical protein K0Q48_2990 [Bacillota bacterium]|nr:hypothetical protein [Bacillota bacterium]